MKLATRLRIRRQQYGRGARALFGRIPWRRLFDAENLTLWLALGLLARGGYLAWAPLAYLLPGLVLVFMVLFLGGESADEPAANRRRR